MCDKTYRYKQNLTQHIKWHNGQKDYHCNECNKYFSQSGNLKSHVQSIHRAPFKCHLCDKSFKQKESLNFHVQKHNGIIKTLKCDMCFKAFAKPSLLKTHSAIHSNKRSFKCNFDGCDKTFNLSRSLRVHQITHSGLKPYQCEICEIYFSAKTGLRGHIQGVHKNEKLHSCSQCIS